MVQEVDLWIRKPWSRGALLCPRHAPAARYAWGWVPFPPCETFFRGTDLTGPWRLVQCASPVAWRGRRCGFQIRCSLQNRLGIKRCLKPVHPRV